MSRQLDSPGAVFCVERHRVDDRERLNASTDAAEHDGRFDVIWNAAERQHSRDINAKLEWDLRFMRAERGRKRWCTDCAEQRLLPWRVGRWCRRCVGLLAEGPLGEAS